MLQYCIFKSHVVVNEGQMQRQKTGTHLYSKKHLVATTTNQTTEAILVLSEYEYSIRKHSTCSLKRLNMGGDLSQGDRKALLLALTNHSVQASALLELYVLQRGVKLPHSSITGDQL